MTSLCDVHVKYLRENGYDNLMEFCQDSNNVYVGRAGIVFVKIDSEIKERYPKKSSPFANPFKGENCIEEYYEYITERIESGELLDELKKLKGKRLGCWCVKNFNSRSVERDQWKCHGHVLLHLIEKYC